MGSVSLCVCDFINKLPKLKFNLFLLNSFELFALMKGHIIYISTALNTHKCQFFFKHFIKSGQLECMSLSVPLLKEWKSRLVCR